MAATRIGAPFSVGVKTRVCSNDRPPGYRGPQMSWTMFLDAAPEAGHAVQIYDDVAELSNSVAHFLDAGFRAGEPALVIATAAHWKSFAAELEKRGWDLELLREQGLLT